VPSELDDRPRDEAAIRQLIEDRLAAVRARDIGRLLPAYAPDVVSFDVVDPLRATGSDAIRTRLQNWLSSFEGPLGFEMQDLVIAAGPDVAFCRGLSRVVGTASDGRTIDMWYRTTICLQKSGGRWLITHEHDSVPIDGSSGKASLDLKP
jgi:uncharacterized protein (TIGR02246 family)